VVFLSKDNELVKVLSLEKLRDTIAACKMDSKRVIHCHGVFDLLHIGHIRHFEEAKGFGDVLVVTITPDRFVNKGPHRPAFPEELRAQTIASLRVVDHVAINRWPTAVETIDLIRPDVYCKGGDYRTAQVDASQNLGPEVEAANRLGVEVAYTDDEVIFSSSELLNQHFSPFDADTDAWLRNFRSRYSAEDVIKLIDSAQQIRVLVVGEVILDEYIYCTAMGKSTKDPVLACRYHESESYVGGSLAIANHLSGFCRDVTVLSYVGDREDQEAFLLESLSENVKPHFLTKDDSPTIVKQRFVDPYTKTKLLELYRMNDAPLKGENERAFTDALKAQLAEHDVVIVADYGHGLMTGSSIDLLKDYKGFLAVNAQSNAGNRGFNPISKYPRADYICLAQHEMVMETRTREASTRDLVTEVSSRIDCDSLTVTLGRSGSLHYSPAEGFVEVPAFATRIVDRVGAGDGFLALSSLLRSQGAPWDVVGFVGNVAGAQLVAELGNRRPLDRIDTAKHIISLMK
jgi:rfaE bifunctional protein kinase chain/domain/rfaE bifunctional protein nucleotidyltransferase chain/domain